MTALAAFLSVRLFEQLVKFIVKQWIFIALGNDRYRIKGGIRFGEKIHFITHYQFITKVLLDNDKQLIKKPEHCYSGFH
ncbi:hypothetical protein DBZ36_17735 [Alginatibacterium sediminis]|uniref:Uncharacterized protein n=1 Tax=Alginatibacterium sediminis TaxID=2164068 RepID=A0A420E7J3_9ALTE|nr:hypothetical protein DBZ36_17735 [Alginatibacterium sediminis]